MPAFRRSRDEARGRLGETSREDGQSAAARAVTGFLLGIAVGAVAAFVTPRRQQSTGPADPEGLPSP